MDDSANELSYFLVWPLQRQRWVLLRNCLVGALPYSHYVMRSFPLCGVRVLHPAHYDIQYLDNHYGDRKKRNKKTVPWLSSSRSDWHVLQRPCQPNANPNIHEMFYSVGANRGQLLYVYIFFQEGGSSLGSDWERQYDRASTPRTVEVSSLTSFLNLLAWWARFLTQIMPTFFVENNLQPVKHHPPMYVPRRATEKKTSKAVTDISDFRRFQVINAFTTGNPFFGVNLLGISIGRDSGL